MIAIDTSALIAVINGKPERQRFLEVIAAADRRLISTPRSFRSTTTKHGTPLAFKKFGKGIHSKARLNFGDCASYALAKTYNIPLLYKGEDFAATDIQSAA